MRVGICGAHRVGKTTLAAEYASRNYVDFLQQQVSGVFAKLGLPVDGALTVEQRISVQCAVLESFKAITGRRMAFVVDRTPVDFMAYTLANITQADLLDERVDGWVHDYVRECVTAAAKGLDLIVLIRPGIAVVPAEGKGILSSVYIKKLDALMVGILSSLGVRYVTMPASITSLSARLDWLQQQIKA
jgi:hypothetical protein